jgi:hypothetical protein
MSVKAMKESVGYNPFLSQCGDLEPSSVLPEDASTNSGPDKGLTMERATGTECRKTGFESVGQELKEASTGSGILSSLVSLNVTR